MSLLISIGSAVIGLAVIVLAVMVVLAILINIAEGIGESIVMIFKKAKNVVSNCKEKVCGNER